MNQEFYNKCPYFPYSRGHLLEFVDFHPKIPQSKTPLPTYKS